MAYIKKAMLVALSGAALTCGSVQAVQFVNGDFEQGTFNGWTQTQGKWYGPDAIFSDTELGITFNDCEIVNSIFPDLNAGGTLTGFEGNKAARVNNDQGGYHWSKISQTVEDWQEDNIFFSWSAVLQDPINDGHTENENEPGDLGPMFRVLLFNETTQKPLYDFVGSPFGSLPVNGGWKKCAPEYGNWLYSDWQNVGLSTSNYVGDKLTLSFTAYDCAEGAHGGYVYVDRVGSTPVPDGASTMMLLGGAVAGLGMLRRFMRK